MQKFGYSRRAQIKARGRKLKAMTQEERETFLAKEAVDIAEAQLVKRSIGRNNAMISSSPKQEDF